MIRRISLLLLVLLIGPLAALAQVESDAAGRGGWKSVGPAPPTIGAPIAAFPSWRRIYINTLGGGLFRSKNGGSTFVALENSPRGESTLAVDPRDPNVVYVGFSKSTDGGATWTGMSGGGSLALVMDPTNPDVIYGVGGDILKTIDGGETWFPAGEGVFGAISLAIDPFHTDVLYAGTDTDGAFKSVDGGLTWSPLGIAGRVRSLLVDPGNGNIVYAGTDGKGVFKSIDGGATFARVGSPRRGIAFSLAKSGDRLYAATDVDGAWVSRDGGTTWRNTGVAEGRGYALSVDGAGAVYLGTNFEGAFVLPANGRQVDAQRDRDAQWERLGWKALKNCECQQGFAIAVDPSDHERVFLTGDAGLLVSEDGGRSWNDGNLHGLVAGAPGAIAFDPRQSRRVYAGSGGSGFFKSTDHGKHWERRVFGAGNQLIHAVAVDPVDHSVYAATVFGDGVWKSTDFGDTFTRIDRAPGAPPDEFLDLSGRGIAVDPKNHTTVYFTDRASGTWRSQDAGASWVNVDPNPAQNVTVDPVDSSIVYVGSFFLGVLKSVDGGASFTVKSNGLPDPLFMPVSGGVKVNPAHHKVLYVGTGGDGGFKSTDGGESWSSLVGLEGVAVGGFAIDPVQPSIVYAATSSSVYKTRTGGE
jgi:photosystem II stability/assembly factor-like uncharacterized protein